MEHTITSRCIPGTILDREKMNGASGMEFLDKVFYITDGIMLAQVREITGIDGTTLQNWLKRGWVSSPHNKMYKKDQLARIMLIQMMRDTMQLSCIATVLRYINGRAGDVTDDIIPESWLYEYVCRVVAVLADKDSQGLNELDSAVAVTVADYKERCAGDRERLAKGLSIIVTTYYASLVKNHAEAMLDECCPE